MVPLTRVRTSEHLSSKLRLMVCLILGFAAVGTLRSQGPKPASAKHLEMTIVPFSLDDESVFEGFAKLNQQADISFSIERILTPKHAGPLREDPRFTRGFTGKTLREALDWLCDLDKRYSWLYVAGVVNVVPTASIHDPQYLLNRRLPRLVFESSRDAGMAAISTLHQLSSPPEQLAFLQMGGSVNFPKPWNARFENLTVREAFNLIAQQVGPIHGWQFSGAEDFRLIMFHYKLEPRPKKTRPISPQ